MAFLKNLAGQSALGPGSCGSGSCLFPWSTIPPPPTIRPGPKPWGPPWCLMFSHPTSHPWADPACSSFRVQPPPDCVLTSSALAPLPWTRAVTPLWAPCSCPWSPPPSVLHPAAGGILLNLSPSSAQGPPVHPVLLGYSQASSKPCGPFEICPLCLSDHLSPQLLCPGHTRLLAGPPTGQGPPASGPLHLLLL